MCCANQVKTAENQKVATKVHHGDGDLFEKCDHKTERTTVAKCCCSSAKEAADDTVEKSAGELNLK
jgi:hypothetical protein